MEEAREGRIKEKDLVIPALYCINRAEGQILSTSDPYYSSERIASPHWGRFRNLKSHDTLERLKGCEYLGDGYWKLTPYGADYLAKHEPLLEYLIDNGFAYEDAKRAFDDIPEPQEKDKVLTLFDEDGPIQEGREREAKRGVYIRSPKLREMAIAHYSKQGAIWCYVCGFNFEDVYGEYGKGFIEIHHIKPIYLYEQEDFDKKLQDALANVVPLCPNCHRMIHRRKNTMLSIEELKQIVATRRNI